MPEDPHQPVSTPSSESHLSRELIDDDSLAMLAEIEQTALVDRRINAAIADGYLSTAEQTIGNIAAVKVASGSVDPIVAAILNHPT